MDAAVRGDRLAQAFKNYQHQRLGQLFRPAPGGVRVSEEDSISDCEGEPELMPRHVQALIRDRVVGGRAHRRALQAALPRDLDRGQRFDARQDLLLCQKPDHHVEPVAMPVQRPGRSRRPNPEQDSMPLRDDQKIDFLWRMGKVSTHPMTNLSVIVFYGKVGHEVKTELAKAVTRLFGDTVE